MKININYPKPILSPFSNDFKIGSFDYDCSYNPDTQYLEVKCHLTNKTIQNYIDNGDMSFAIRLSCSNSRFRDSMVSNSPTMRMKIDSEKVRNNAELDVFIVAMKKIENFDTIHLADVYKDFPVSYDIGDYVAVSPSSNISIELDNKISKPFIKYEKTESIEDSNVDISVDVISILLSPENYNRYIIYKNNPIYSQLIFHAITVPALTTALYKAVSMGDEFDYDSCNWAKAIVEKSDFTWDEIVDDPSIISELISTTLDNPTNRFFDSLDSIDMGDDE